MSIEQNLETTIQFIPVWQKRPERILPELISLHNETNRKTDRYHFLYKDGKLLDPHTGRDIMEFIDSSGYLGKIETNIAKSLVAWTGANEEGSAFWATPRYPGRYPCSKIIEHRIAYTPEGERVLINAADLYDAPPDVLLDLFSTLGIDDLESLRRTLFVNQDPEELLTEIHTKMEKYLIKSTNDLNGENLTFLAKYYEEMILAGVDPQVIAEEMEKSEFVGQHQISCPTFSEFILQIDRYGPLRFNCPACGRVNTRPFNTLIPNCQHCGADVRC